jgi:hypothetical protein
VSRVQVTSPAGLRAEVCCAQPVVRTQPSSRPASTRSLSASLRSLGSDMWRHECNQQACPTVGQHTMYPHALYMHSPLRLTSEGAAAGEDGQMALHALWSALTSYGWWRVRVARGAMPEGCATAPHAASVSPRNSDNIVSTLSPQQQQLPPSRGVAVLRLRIHRRELLGRLRRPRPHPPRLSTPAACLRLSLNPEEDSMGS